MKIPNGASPLPMTSLSLARIVSEDSQLGWEYYHTHDKSSKDS